MIDWVNVAFSSLWIVGLALILAALSYYTWMAKEEGVAGGLALQQSPFRRFVYAGLLLVGVGLLGTSSNAVETFLAVVLIALCCFGLIRLLNQTRNNHQ